MSGHSKWANIKNRKGAQDKKRSEAFTKLSKDILTAIRSSGGNTNIESNLGLKMAIDKAKAVNMPKENIERLISRFEERKANLVSVLLEGFGPFGVPIIVDTQTDNKNRILSEIKLIFRNNGGTLGESNSVMFQFDRLGEIEVNDLNEEKQLELIDIGVDDFDENLVWVKVELLSEIVEKIKSIGLEVLNFGIVYKPLNPIKLEKEEDIEKMINFIEELEENDDVVGVYAGFDYN